MLYSFLAAIIAVLHSMIVVILVPGVLLALFDKLNKWPILEKAYLASAVLMIVSYVITGSCYLTVIEQWLWKKTGSSFLYSGGCISHYLSFAGVQIADKMIFWILTGSLLLGLGSYAIRYIFRHILLRPRKA